MELNNSFEVNRSIADTWAVITDVERIAPCLPGAQLQEIDGDEYRGIVKVKVGPITAQYKGAATFIEKNDAEYRAVLNGKGRDTRGAGNAEAVITATLESVSDTVTRVDVDTVLKITGKVAQFGRGVMADVSAKLLKQFADNLETMLEETPAEPADADDSSDSPVEPAPATEEAPSGPRRIDMPEPEAVDLLDAAGTPVLKRLAPVIALILVVLIIRRLRRK